MTEQVEQQICLNFRIKLEYSSMETVQMIQKAPAMDNWWLAASSQECSPSCITSCAEFFGKTPNHPSDSDPYSTDLVPCDLQLFPKLKSLLKGKRFQTVEKIQKNTMGQLMAIGRTVCDPKVPTLKGTEASLSYAQCFLYLVSSAVNIYIFHITQLDTFWTELITLWNFPFY